MQTDPKTPVADDSSVNHGTQIQPGASQLSIWTVLFLIFAPSLLLLLAYIPSVYLWRDTLPPLLMFFILASLILFPIQLLVVLFASTKEYGRYSLDSAFTCHRPLSWLKVVAIASVIWAFAGIMSVTVAPLEERLFAPVSERLWEVAPAYFDWTDFDYLEQFPGNILLLTALMYLILNGFIGPIVEELFFRGYLTAKLSRYGDYAPLIVTVLFSLYHWWLPFNNLFRIIAFFPAAYAAWRMKNIYIAILFHVLSNLVSSIAFLVAIYAIL